MTPQAGWYQDPDNAHQQRWWDGQMWSPYTRTVPPAAAGFVQQQPSSGSKLAVPALVLSCLGLFSCGVLGIIGSVLGAVGLHQERGEPRNRGLLVSSIVVGLLTVVFWLLLFLIPGVTESGDGSSSSTARTPQTGDTPSQKQRGSEESPGGAGGVLGENDYMRMLGAFGSVSDSFDDFSRNVDSCATLGDAAIGGCLSFSLGALGDSFDDLEADLKSVQSRSSGECRDAISENLRLLEGVQALTEDAESSLLGTEARASRDIKRLTEALVDYADQAERMDAACRPEGAIDSFENPITT